MQGLPQPDPYPTFSLPEGLDPHSPDSVRRFISNHAFPSAQGGGFLFAYAAEDNVREVWLCHRLAGHRQPQKMIRCDGDLHLLRMQAPRVHRAEYTFRLVDGNGTEASVLDPLNPQIVRDPFSSASVLAAADYRPPAYVNEPPPEARGCLKEFMIEGPAPSRKTWQTWIWSPPSVRPGQRLPIVVFLDGGDWLQLASACNILENLIHERSIASCYAVFMKPASRNEEYAANSLTADFLANDLPRRIAEHIPWPLQAENRIAVGVSLGALCLLHAHFTQPASQVPFGELILQSGSFFQPTTDAMETGFPHFHRICEFVSHACSESRHENVARIAIHMTCGGGEENIINNITMAETLRRHGFSITFHQQPDAHNWTCWRDSVGEGLKRMLPPAPAPLSIEA